MRNRIRLLALLCAVLLLAGCAGHPYREQDLLGKDSRQIEAQYGTFDCVTMPPDADGLYRAARAGYTIRPARPGLLGTVEEELFFILFDQNGIAVDCEIGPRPGG